MRGLLIELAHLVAGLLAVALVTEAAAWSYPLGRETIAWTGRIVAVAVVLLALPALRDGWRGRRHG